MMRWLLGILGLVGVMYAAAAAFLYFQQDRFIYPAPAEAAAKQPWYDEVEIETRDGLTLRSFHRPAENGQPTAVYFHGNGGSLLGSIHATRSLADAGYGLLLAEYRGYGGNAGNPAEEGLYEDGRAAIAWLAEQGVERSRLIVMGNSLGTGVAVQMASEFEPLAVVLSAPFTSLPDAVAGALPYFPGRYLVTGAYDSMDKIGDITAPVLILHGAADTLIPADHGAALAEASTTATYVKFDGLGHNAIFSPLVQRTRDEWLASLQ